MIEHRSLANFIKGMTGILEFTGTDSILSLTTISFDIFGLETILPLTKGSRVVMGTKEEQLNPAAAALALDEEDITILQVTPARLALLLSNERSANGLKHLKYLLVGGEVFPGQLLGKTREVAAGKIFNLYGPTETTIWSTVKEVSQGETLNIGKPTANTRVYIMNGSRILQPVGIFGELWISGAGLARGYINRGELTNRKFIIDPYETGEYMYHTGDIARWLPDGNIEFLGRKDNQVKIRGFRIELSEIENHLKKYKEIQEAVVLDREDRNGDRHLCAYVVTVNEHAVPGLREYLSQHLPNYMIPTYFMKLDKIPLTPNGKTDRKALPEPGVSVDSPMYTAPQNENEEKLVELWATVLGIKKEKIGVNDNFFDRGGSSLTIIRLAGKLEETLDREIPVTMLFRYPTIRALSEYLDRGGVPGETGFDTEKLDLIRDSIRDTLNIFGDD
jgi:acyl-CoA synthetase (AMP-forming)/AMP-acid ligase II/acyl carrier protein